MRTVADLHIHSRYSLATSSKLTPPELDAWARIKGIGLLGTGDCTHPAWLDELRGALEPVEEGFYGLKDEVRRAFDCGEALSEGLPARPREGASPGEAPREGNPRFVLTGEISTIYSREGRTRKVHHLVILPDFGAAEAFSSRLAKLGNISSDGRPILGIDSRDLFSLLLESDDRSILVPAHIWTPWFSALGSRSGFDSIDECYGEFAPRIGAIETGLSSNPPMNWALSALDRFSIISNSDAHSPEKLGREATVMDLEGGFSSLAEALSGGGKSGSIVETIEFFPQEGKYHYDGHRACKVSLDPEESAAAGGICPVCGKALTPGVLRRVRELADRGVDEEASCPSDWVGTNRRPYLSLIPLKELLSELLGTGAASKKTAAAYNALVEKAGSELALLVNAKTEAIEAMGQLGVSGELLALAIGRMRSGQVSIVPGYDGEYGRIRAFAPGERIEARSEKGLFGDQVEKAQKRVAKKRSSAKVTQGAEKDGTEAAAAEGAVPPLAFKLESAQERAVAHPGGPALVIAGPGTGKTAVLALRVERLVAGGLSPSAILALTFTNKAAGELRSRLAATLGQGAAAEIAAGTFHSFCRSLLKEEAEEVPIPHDFDILDEEARDAILKEVAGKAAIAKRLGPYIEGRKRFLILPGSQEPRLGSGAPDGLPALAKELGLPPFDDDLDALYEAYRKALKRVKALDFDDLLAGAARLLAAKPALLARYRNRFRAIFVDEYQDVNFAQYALVRLLAPAEKSELFVIGDPNQAIYGFRGADRRFIDRFIEDYPGAELYRLSRSFRCAPEIVGAAGALADAGLEGTGAAVVLERVEYPTDKSEAEGIAREIDALIGGTRFFARDSGVAVDGDAGLRSLGDCAILLRAVALAGPMEKALLDHGIPYRLIGENPEEAYAISNERVSLMTIHAAKGLEFDHVFVAGLEDGLLPFTLYDDAGDESSALAERIEEEKRILYVAMTRARVGLHLSWAKSRNFKGRELALPPSRFLTRLEELVPLAKHEPRRQRDPQLGFFY
jgi:DNA helicase II / ATP-dependent DNA helicase PcrA